MTYALLEKSSPSTATQHRLERSLFAKMKALQERLDNFTVLDRYGTPVGDVRNLVLHRQQLSLVIVQPDVQRHWRFVLLTCHLVERISLRDRVVHVRTTQAEMSYLPEYRAVHHAKNHRNGVREQPSLLPSIQPLSAALTERTQPLELAKKKASGWLTAQKEALQPPVIGKASSLLDAPPTPKVLAPTISTIAPELSHLTHQANHASAFGSVSFSGRVNAAFPQNEQHLQAQAEESPARMIALLEHTPISTATSSPPSQLSTVQSEFTSPKHASQLLDAIAKTLSRRCKTIRIEIELDDPALQGVCQSWLNQYVAMSKN